MADRLQRYRAKRDFASDAGAAVGPATHRKPSSGSWCRSTPLARCTGTCGSSTRARSPPGRSRSGIPADPKRNHLAVRTEDHPLEYLDFHGEIPAGSYGAGTMRIFDRGTYEPHKWRDEEVMVTFHGERVRGRYVLFRTGGKNWMIHRMDPPEDPDRAPMPDQIKPMLARSGTLPAGDGWAYEIKWDGVRAIGYAEGGRLRLESRNGNDDHAALPGVARPRARARHARGGPRRRDRRVGRGAAGRASSASSGACT